MKSIEVVDDISKNIHHVLDEVEQTETAAKEIASNSENLSQLSTHLIHFLNNLGSNILSLAFIKESIKSQLLFLARR